MRNSSSQLPSVTNKASKSFTPLEVFALHQEGKLDSLQKMSREGRMNVARKLIATFLSLNGFFQCSVKLSEENAAYLAEEVFDQYGGWMTGEDVKIVIRRIKRKKLYNALTPGDIMEEFEKYDEEHCQVAQRYHQQQSKKEAEQQPTNLPYTIERDEDGKQVMKVSETLLDSQLYDAWVELGCARRVKEHDRIYWAQMSLQRAAKAYIEKYGTQGRDEEKGGQVIHLSAMDVAIREVIEKYKSTQK